MMGDSGGDPREHQVDYLLTELRRVAGNYADVRGLPLRLTNEVGELEAERQLRLRLVRKRGKGHDALDHSEARICIRSRVVADVADPGPICINGIKLDGAWDAVVLVLLGKGYELRSIHRAERADLMRAMRVSPNRKPSAKPAFSINTFLKNGRMVWPATPG